MTKEIAASSFGVEGDLGAGRLERCEALVDDGDAVGSSAVDVGESPIPLGVVLVEVAIHVVF